jgi:hypothetical protein
MDREIKDEGFPVQIPVPSPVPYAIQTSVQGLFAISEKYNKL